MINEILINVIAGILLYLVLKAFERLVDYIVNKLKK